MFWLCAGKTIRSDMKLQTVNVIEYRADAILSIQSFTDNEEGNKEAEEVFESIMRERNGVVDEDVEVSLEDGWYEEGDYQLFLTHSS
jgi:hypothetical protein